MIYFERGSVNDVLTEEILKEAINSTLSDLGQRKKILAIPPDFTRFHSQAGMLTTFVYDFYKKKSYRYTSGTGYTYTHE